jgi:hypothetical protein
MGNSRLPQAAVHACALRVRSSHGIPGVTRPSPAYYYREQDVVDVDSFSAFTFLCDTRPCSLPESGSTFTLSLWERAGVR